MSGIYFTKQFLQLLHISGTFWKIHLHGHSLPLWISLILGQWTLICQFHLRHAWQFDQGEQPAWRQPKIVPQGKTLPDNSQPHSFDNTIIAPEWSHNQGLEDHLYNRFCFSLLNHQSQCTDEALDWDKVSKTLRDTASTVEHYNRLCIRAFITHMILNHTDARALQLYCYFDLSTDAKYPFQNASSLRARWLNLHDNRQHLYDIYSQQDLESQLSWSLIVANSAAILQCFRANLGGSVQNAACLLHSGIPFNTFAPSLQMDSNLPKKLTYAVHKLTHCPIKPKPTTGDYMRYEEIHDRVVSHPYNGQLSLKVELCGDSHCRPLNIQLILNSLSLRVPQRVFSKIRFQSIV